MISLIKKRYIYIALIALISGLNFYCEAQSYRYSEIFDAHGQIKELRLNSQNKIAPKKIKFKKDGRGGPNIMTYNDDGLPIGCEMFILGNANFMKFFYDEADRLDSVSIQSKFKKNFKNINIKNNYSDSVMTHQSIYLKSNDEGIQKFELFFTDYKYDDHHNWILRKVNGTHSEDGFSKDIEYTETREFKYY